MLTGSGSELEDIDVSMEGAAVSHQSHSTLCPNWTVHRHGRGTPSGGRHIPDDHCKWEAEQTVSEWLNSLGLLVGTDLTLELPCQGFRGGEAGCDQWQGSP